MVPPSISSFDPAARKLVLKLALIAAGLVATLSVAFLLLPISDRLYIAAINDKYDMLVEADSPKIVLIGGSNLAFGLDSERVERELGYRVVNIGIHGGLGLRFMLQLVKPHLKAGDVVVFIPEYGLLMQPTPGIALAEALAVFPRGARYVDPVDVDSRVFLRALQRRFWFAIGFEVDREREVYSRFGFNSHGDLTAHIGAPRKFQPTPEDSLDISTFPDPLGIELMNEFDQACREIGVRVALSFSPYPRSLAPESESDATRWKSQLVTALNLTVVSNPSDYFFPIDHFYDTQSHLSGDGREARTAQLIGDLQPFLEH